MTTSLSGRSTLSRPKMHKRAVHAVLLPYTPPFWNPEPRTPATNHRHPSATTGTYPFPHALDHPPSSRRRCHHTTPSNRLGPKLPTISCTPTPPNLRAVSAAALIDSFILSLPFLLLQTRPSRHTVCSNPRRCGHSHGGCAIMCNSMSPSAQYFTDLTDTAPACPAKCPPHRAAGRHADPPSRIILNPFPLCPLCLPCPARRSLGTDSASFQSEAKVSLESAQGKPV